MVRPFAFVFLVSLVVATPALAQERFSLFVPTEQDDVPRMLKLAGLRDGDVVFDLGSGDGRIVLEAAKSNPTVRGRGIEIDEKLVFESRKTAQAAGLANRVQILHQNAFDADLKEASVIAMWLWPELMRMLRPKILKEARPGTRIVTRIWDLGSWKPDLVDTDGAAIHVWVVPAQVEGYWSWTLNVANTKRNYAAVVEQRFQEVEGVVRVGDRRGVLDSIKLNGDDIAFTLLITLPGTKIVRHAFHGTVKGNVIEGTVSIQHEGSDDTVVLPWRAERTTTSAYFAPTGVNSK
ncbi:MAG TPA: class I SAM-dependent methyltransferase [Burkholderiales bacterium]|nr:class I SAM-dependent methyltransferase [Burkholderiales bacterium]